MDNYRYYMNMAITLLYANEFDHRTSLSCLSNPVDCAYFTMAQKYIHNPDCLTPQKAFDMYQDTSAPCYGANTYLGVTFPNNTYMQVNQYYAEYGQLGMTPIDFVLEGRNLEEEDWITLDYQVRFFPTEPLSNIPIYNNIYLYNQIRYVVKDLMYMKTDLYQLLFYTCNLYEDTFQYPEQQYEIYTGFPVDIRPVQTSFTDFVMDKKLPEGLELNPINGRINGTAVNVSEDTDYLIRATMPVRKEFHLHLAVQPCTKGHMIISYTTTYAGLSQAFTVTNARTNVPLFRYYPYMNTKKDTTYNYELCVDYDIYHIQYDKRYKEKEEISWTTGTWVEVHQAARSDLPYGAKDGTYLPIFKGRQEVGGSQNSDFEVNLILENQSTWSVKRDAVPDQWYAVDYDDREWTTEQMGVTPHPYTVTLYRKTVDLKDLDLYGTMDLYIKYVGGLLLYINGQEVVHKYIRAPLTLTTVATNTYTEELWRRITVPTTLFRQGKNVLAIGLAPSVECKELTFDVTMRYAGHGDRYLFDSYPLNTTIKALFDMDYANGALLPTKEPFVIESPNDEYSCLTSYTLVANSADAAESRQLSFVLEGRQFDGDDKAPWTLVDEQKEIFWPYSLYRHMFVVPQNQIGVYNQYRFREVKTYNDLVNYTNELELYSHSLQYNYPELTYNKEVVEVYYHAYLPELYPLSFSYYHDFVITPSLPKGLSIDSTTGRVTGIPEEFTTNSNFIIQAKNPLGEVVQTQITINFSYCSNNHNLVKVGFHIPYETQAYLISADLNEGLDGSGKNVISFRSIQSIYKDDFYRLNSTFVDVQYIYCIPEGYYALSFVPASSTKLAFPGGYEVSNSIDTNSVSTTLRTDETSVLVPMDLYSPIQSNETTWSYLSSDSYSLDWLSKQYNISSWDTTKGGAVPQHHKKYLYMRTLFSIKDTSRHSSLDFKFSGYGSVTIYINRELVYAKKITDTALHGHVFNHYLQGHAIKSNNNILGVLLEPTKAIDMNSINIDMSYTYGEHTRLMNDFTYSSTSTFDPDHGLDHAFDVHFYHTTKFISPEKNIHIQFNNENGVRFNSLYIQLYEARTTQYVSVYGREQEAYDPIPLVENYVLTSTLPLTDLEVPLPMGILGFRYIDIVFTSKDPSTPFVLSRLAFSHTNTPQVLCPSLDNFPAVGENEHSYQLCGYGYQGYIERECDGLSIDVETEVRHCVYLEPKGLSYNTTDIKLLNYVEYSFDPVYENHIVEFSVEPELPEGLTLDIMTGRIHGMVVHLEDAKSYTITGRNPTGSTSTVLSITVEPSQCQGYDDYPTTNVNSVATLGCPPGTSGYRTRPCVYDEVTKYVIWGNTEDFCSSIFLIIGTIVGVVMAIAVVILSVVCYRTNKKNKEEIRKLREHVALSQGVKPTQRKQVLI